MLIWYEIEILESDDLGTGLWGGDIDNDDVDMVRATIPRRQ